MPTNQRHRLDYFLADPVALVVAALLIAASLWIGAGAFRDWVRFGDAPVQVDVQGAVRTAGRQWVSISPGEWSCTRAIERGVALMVPAWSPDGTGIVVAEFPVAVDCQSAVLAQVAGIVRPMPSSLANDLISRGLFKATDSVQLIEASTTNQRNDVRFGVLLCLASVVLAFALFPIRRLSGGFHQRNAERLLAAASAPDGSVEADRAVRKHGLLLLSLAPILFAVTQGRVLMGFVPVSWVSIAIGLLGAALIAFPLEYRRFRRNGRF